MTTRAFNLWAATGALLLRLSACYSLADCPQGITPLAVTWKDSSYALWRCGEENSFAHGMALDSAQRARVKQ